jgi:hypothetical protein
MRYGQRQYNQCLRDYGWYLRLVTYGVLAGDKHLFNKLGLIGVKEMYNSLNVPVPGMVEGDSLSERGRFRSFDSRGCRGSSPLLRLYHPVYVLSDWDNPKGLKSEKGQFSPLSGFRLDFFSDQ